MEKFEVFKKKDKFIEEERLMYPGIGKPEMKKVYTEKINLAADDFKSLAEKNADKPAYQDKIRESLLRFADVYEGIDTEDRERICRYFEELMDIVSLESSGGHLKDFMEGIEKLH